MAKIPVPGQPVRGSKSGVPVMALLDLLGRNWAMGIIWHLNGAPKNFRQLQAYCETVSPTTLNTRLKELRHSGLVIQTPKGYELTALGTELLTLLQPLGKWAKHWAKQFNDHV
ncbi:helix-turn-helix transcriptional regulator [Fulvivirga sp. M361]|uniref:winged helix-turn-helix transcriptional regulator n=1 Tax=Fulvivirga sp. M361 TaxID=2594266 RepID=UPI00117AAE74|nr:helix-turn-helix domain-containing protein [Fulvivirga sp. M361]TRX58788.1 helix-turn-helix transcriptional regulator [Fulvivirga sp. M361]